MVSSLLSQWPFHQASCLKLLIFRLTIYLFSLNFHCKNRKKKDTVSLTLVIHPQNIRLLKGPLYRKSLLLIRLLQLSYKLFMRAAMRYCECSSRTLLGDITLSWQTVSLNLVERFLVLLYFQEIYLLLFTHQA